MATLTIRNLPEGVRHELRVRAARNGRSMEAEVRDLIIRYVTPPETAKSTLGAWMGSLRGRIVVHGDFEEPNEEIAALFDGESS